MDAVSKSFYSFSILAVVITICSLFFLSFGGVGQAINPIEIPVDEPLEVGSDVVQIESTSVISTKSATTYLYAGNLIASKNSDEEPLNYFVQDHLGSNHELEGANLKAPSQKYYAYGESLASSDNDFQYTGKEKDETGLYYYGARYYAPEHGRFIQADVMKGGISSPLTLNRYVYVENNPLKYIDPNGNAPESHYSTYGWSKEDKAADRAGRAMAGKIITELMADTAGDVWTAASGKDIFGEDVGTMGRSFAVAAAFIPAVPASWITKGGNKLRVLMRGDPGAVDDVFKNGMKAGDNSGITLQQHLDGDEMTGYGLSDSPFKSTTTSPNAAASFAVGDGLEGTTGTVYHVVENPGRTIDPVQEGLKRNSAEAEIIFKGSILPSEVIGATPVKFTGFDDYGKELFEFGDFIPNANYK